MQKIGMVQAYLELREGSHATFVHPQGMLGNSRLIKMRMLAESAVNVYLIPVEYDYEAQAVIDHQEEPDDVRFLAHIAPGMEQVEFFYEGSFCLSLVGGSIWLDTFDNTTFNVESADPTSFARLWEREERDPRILEIERAARHNTERLRQQMEADMAKYAADLEERFKAHVPTASSAPVAPAPSGKPESAVVSPTGDNELDTAAPAATGGNA